ncbi:hypothetical protein BKA67DRAFT_571865 [Truncatella angustata]|uniref:Tim44-like domain-containing protein n=1 Tax=Truncatella angustata TaxID=152316 RepID=A0A9P8UGB7_9PEZI|nr:uncharacterized protein BKA67DRAFT_571865 [Truncatella angustata]KAH6651772.1 hypothetical protein BKA67DRAFT_571865 [Truncatella angustata]KAH8196568.1 hypothetical protein TruAng_009262 [Truncatella angustata]
MAERQAARLLQPWLSSPSTSLYARRSIFTPSSLRAPTSRTTSTTTPSEFLAARPFSVQRSLNKKPVRRSPAASRKNPYSRDQSLPVSLDNVSVLVPMTFVPPPMSKWPRGLKDFLHMGWLVTRNRFINYLYMVIHKVYSKPGWKSRPLFKMRKAAIAPAARDLHARMNSAIASGDKDELKRVCTQELYERLSGVVDSRPRGRTVRWELEGGRASCSVRDDRIAMMPLTPSENRTVRQAVVAVSSTQRIVTIDGKRGGVEVPGTSKAKPMRENIVLTSYVDDKTWQQGPWKIWGTLPDSTVQSHIDEVEGYKALTDEQAK